MIYPEQFFEQLQQAGVTFFSGVPDSLLKDFCAFATDNLPSKNHIIAANEGAAVSLAVGYYLGTGAIPLVYMQNSGLGNAVNPLLSLADPDVYSIPMLVLIGWRGEPGVKDEPQHVKQGRVMCEMLEAMEIDYFVLDASVGDTGPIIAQAVEKARATNAPVALLVRKNTFFAVPSEKSPASEYQMSRESAISTIVKAVSDDTAIISTTGKASRELYELRNAAGEGHERDFLTVGSMGHASSIAVGLCIAQPRRPVVCIDGDGAALMHLGSLCVNAQSGCEKFLHIVINNGAHESVGGQPTAGFTSDLASIAHSAGYSGVAAVSNAEDLAAKMADFFAKMNGPQFLEVRVTVGSREDLGRPKEPPQTNKGEMMSWLGQTV